MSGHPEGNPRLSLDSNSDVTVPSSSHCRYYRIGGITIRVEADLPITDYTFADKFKKFRVEQPGAEMVSLRHRFTLPELPAGDPGEAVYRKAPWAIYRHGRYWVYLRITGPADAFAVHQVAVFNADHTRGRIYDSDDETFRRGGLDSLTRFPTDQILLARLLADRQACYLHAAGVVLGGEGLLFVGHSEAGKSTITTMLRDEGEILCDDRIIVRRWPEGFRIHGTWSHGDVPEVSGGDAPLRAILLLQQSDSNRLELISDRRELARQLPFFVIRPLVTADWWEKVLALLEGIIREVPVYRLHFDRSGRVKEVLQQLVD